MTKEKERRKIKREEKERRRRKNCNGCTLSCYNGYFGDTLAEKNCWTEKVHLAITFSKIRLDGPRGTLPYKGCIGMGQLSLGRTEAVKFLDDARQPEVRLLISLDATKFVLLSVFTRIQTIWTKIWASSPPKNAKRPLQDDVRGAKTSLLKLSSVLSVHKKNRYNFSYFKYR